MNIGRRIFYDKSTGNVIVDTGERSGHVVETTIDYDIAVYKSLSDRVRESFDVLELSYGQYAQDFKECVGYRVNPETETLEFIYPDESEGTQEPIYQAPLSEKVAQLEQQNKELSLATIDLADTAALQNAQLQEQGEALVDLANTLAEVVK